MENVVVRMHYWQKVYAKLKVMKLMKELMFMLTI